MTIYVAARSDAHLGTTHFGFARSRERGREDAAAMTCLRQFSSAWYAPGSRVACSHREIPQVGETYASIGVAPHEAWGFETGVNEHAVAVAYEKIATREGAEVQPGLDGNDLTRLALERGRNAREALEITAALIERFGHAGRGTAAQDRHDFRFVFADPSEAWCLECAGRRWVARRVTRRMSELPAGAPETRDDWEIASKGLDAYAREQWEWEGAGRLDFADVFAREKPAAKALGAPAAAGIGLGELTHCLRASTAPTASLGVTLPHDRQRPWPIWVCAGPAAVGVQLPVYVDAALPPEAGETSGAFEALAAGAIPDDDLVVARLREAWKGFEADLERERRQVEREVAELIASTRRADGMRTLGAWSADLWSRAAAQASELAALLNP